MVGDNHHAVDGRSVVLQAAHLHAVEAAAVVCEGAEIEAEHLPAAVRGGAAGNPGGPGGPTHGTPMVTLEELELMHIRRALEVSGGHRGNAAQMLGISRTTLYRSMREYGL